MIGLASRTLLQMRRPDRMRHFKLLEAAQWLPADDLATLSRDNLTALLRHAAQQVPYYGQVCSEAGLDPSTVTADDLDHFPRLTKTDLMEDQARFFAGNAAATDRVPNATGGSSGVWFNFFVDRSSVERRTANAMRGMVWAGWKPGEKQAVLWGHPRDNKTTHSLRGRLMASLVHRSVNLNAYDMDDAVLADYARRLKAWKPVMIRGYASALAFLADYLTREGVDVPAPRGIISSAETLTDEHRASIEGYFGCRLLNRYGSREFADIAHQCEQVAGLHIFTDRVHVEILRPDGSACDPGERGEIVITDLENRVMPFIRYRTGDLGRIQAAPCSCGRGFPLLEAVEGRTSELIVGRNGKYYSCQSPRLFGADIPGIGQMQLIQDTLAEIEIRIVPDDRWTEESRASLIARMTGLLGDINLTISLVDEIPPAPSGKYPFTISRVSPFSR